MKVSLFVIKNKVNFSIPRFPGLFPAVLFRVLGHHTLRGRNKGLKKSPGIYLGLGRGERGEGKGRKDKANRAGSLRGKFVGARAFRIRKKERDQPVRLNPSRRTLPPDAGRGR